MSTKESHGWHDLPQPVQLEIFAFLSVKHVAKVHSLSKAISQQLDESEYYWQELALNYARKINPDLIDQVKQQSADQTVTPREKFETFQHNFDSRQNYANRKDQFTKRSITKEKATRTFENANAQKYEIRKYKHNSSRRRN